MQKHALTKLIVCRLGISGEFCKNHRSELLAILALKHVTPDFYLGLFRFVFNSPT